MFQFACPQWPNLYVYGVARFEDGFFTTDDPSVAERLSHIDGVVLVSDPASHTPAENQDAVPAAPVSTAVHEPTLDELQAELAALRAEVEAEHNQGAH